MDDVTWGALALALTALGGAWTWWAFRHRGPAAGLRGLAITLLPPAAWLTGTLGMFTRIAGAITWWASGLVLSPAVWVGITAASTSVLLWLVAKGLDRRHPAVSSRRRRGSEAAEAAPTHPSVKSKGPAVDDDFADIEELLRRKGIE